MLRTVERVTMWATVHLLAAGILLVLASLLGLGAGWPVVLVLAIATGTLYVGQERVVRLGEAVDHNVEGVLATAWVVPVLAAVTALVAYGATPGELQSLGGLLGLAGMGNYFLRPVYVGVYSLVVDAVDGASAESQ